MTNQGFDNSGRLINETTTMQTSEGQIVTVTQYGYRGNERYVINQNVTVREFKTGKVSGGNVMGGKILP